MEQGTYLENVSYATGDPLSIFDYIPHTIYPDGSVLLSKDAIWQIWDEAHQGWPIEIRAKMKEVYYATPKKL